MKLHSSVMYIMVMLFSLFSNTRRTAEVVLDDLKHDFNKVQKKMSKDVNDNLAKRKRYCSVITPTVNISIQLL